MVVRVLPWEFFSEENTADKTNNIHSPAWEISGRLSVRRKFFFFRKYCLGNMVIAEIWGEERAGDVVLSGSELIKQVLENNRVVQLIEGDSCLRHHQRSRKFRSKLWSRSAFTEYHMSKLSAYFKPLISCLSFSKRPVFHLCLMPKETAIWHKSSPHGFHRAHLCLRQGITKIAAVRRKDLVEGERIEEEHSPVVGRRHNKKADMVLIWPITHVSVALTQCRCGTHHAVRPAKLEEATKLQRE